MLTIYSPSTYALTLTREDVMVWIMNHDVGRDLLETKTRLTYSGHRYREGKLEQHHRQAGSA
jgi:hypothetical protein